MVFIDLAKAYDKVPKEMMWWALERKKVATSYIELTKYMYHGVVTNVKTGVSPRFSISIDLHQRSALRLYFFTLIMDEITNDIQGEVHWCAICR